VRCIFATMRCLKVTQGFGHSLPIESFQRWLSEPAFFGFDRMARAAGAV